MLGLPICLSPKCSDTRPIRPKVRPIFPIPQGAFFALVLLLFLATSACTQTPNGHQDFYFLSWDESGLAQLFYQKSSGEPEQVTNYDREVHDYAISPDGRSIILVTEGSLGSQLWLMDLDGRNPKRLAECDQAECANLTWAPDSRRVMFEKRLLDADGMAGMPTLWWLDTATGTTRQVLQEMEQFSANGRLSPDGRWLSYVSPNQEGLVLYNFEDGRTQFVLNEIGTPAVWSPTGEHLVVPRFDLVITHGEVGDDHQAHEHEYETAVHLFRLDVDSEEWYPISGDLAVEDSVPAWSPDGEWIAFGRRALGTGSARQLWLTRPDGSEMRPLTDDALINHGPPSWSSDGRFLLFQQTSQDDLAADPSIWRLDLQTGAKEQLVDSGMRPAWQPVSSQ